MIVEIPDKGIEIEFPDDMPQGQISSIIQRDIYGVQQKSAQQMGFAETLGSIGGDDPTMYSDAEPVIRAGQFKEGLKDVARTGLHGVGAFARTGVTPYEMASKAVTMGLNKLTGANVPPSAPITNFVSPVAEKVSRYAATEALQPDPEMQPRNWGEAFIRTVPQVGTQIVGSMINPAIGTALIGAQIAGGTYEDLISKGVEPDKAAIWGLANATMQAPLEQLGINRAMRFFKQRGKIIDLLKSSGQEFLTEWAQSYPDAFVNIFAPNPDKSLLDKTKTYLEQLGETTLQGMYEGSLTAPFSLLPGSVNIALGRDNGPNAPKIETVTREQPELPQNIQQETPQRPNIEQSLGLPALPPGQGFELVGRPYEGKNRIVSARGANQEIINRTNIEAENESAMNESVRHKLSQAAEQRRQSYKTAIETARDAGMNGVELPSMASFSRVQQNRIKQSYQDGLDIRKETENFVNQEGPKYAERSGKAFTPVGSEIIEKRETKEKKGGEQQVSSGPVRLRDDEKTLRMGTEQGLERVDTDIQQKEPSAIEARSERNQPGSAWINGQRKPIVNVRLINRGKNKGKYSVNLTAGRDEAGNIKIGRRKIISASDIVTMPVEVKAKPIEGDPTKFKTTQDAIAYGEKATPEQIKELARLEKGARQKEAEYSAKKDFSDDRAQNAYMAQLYREAQEAAKGKHPAQILKKPTGSSEIANDIWRKSADLILKGIDTFPKFRREIKSLFSESWNKIKNIIRELFVSAKRIIGNQRGEIKIGKDITGDEDWFNDPNDEQVKKGALRQKYDQTISAAERPFNDFMYWIVDKNRPFSQVQKKLDEVSDDIDVFLKETQRPKRTAVQIKSAWENEFKPFISDIAKSGKNLADLEEYAHAKHVPEANKALAEANSKRYLDIIFKVVPKKESLSLRKEMDELLTKKRNALKLKKTEGSPLSMQAGLEPKDYFKFLEKAFKQFGENDKIKKIKSKWDDFSSRAAGMTDEESAEILKKYNDDKSIEELRLKLSAINQGRLDLLFDSGLITDEEYKAYQNKYQFYVPLYREGYSDSLFGPTRGLRPTGRPVKVRGGSTRKVVNIVGNSIANYEKAINLAEKARSTSALKDLVENNPDPDLWSLKKEKKSPRYDKYGNIQMYPDMFNVSDNEFRFKADGEQYILEVNRDNRDAMLMLRTLKAEDSHPGPILNRLAKLNQFLARVNTSWSPEFIVSNFARDFQTANINIKDTGVKGKNMFKGAREAIHAIWRVETGKPKNDETEKMYERFKAAGGKIGWSDVHSSVENLSKKITREIETQQGKRPVRKTIQQWGQFIEAANTSIENGIRLHVFKLAVNQGISDERAAQIASDLTVDFTKKGAAGPVINSLYLFANAGIQGSYRILRAATKSREVQKILASIFGAGFLIGILNSLAGDDEDGEDYFNKIDDYIRERNAIFVIPGTKGKYVKIPLPWGYNVVWNAGSELSRAFTKEKFNPLESAMNLGTTFFNAFNPVAAGTLLQTLSPTVTDPFAQVAENKNWFGGPLIPPEDPYAKVPKPDSQRYWKSARIPSVWVAQTLNQLTGGDKVKKGKIDISPATLDLILDTVLGSAGRVFIDTLDLPMKFVRGEESQIHKMPFIRRVFGQQSEWSDSRIYFDNIEKVYTVRDQLEAYKGTPYYNDLLKDTQKEQSMIPLANKIEKRLKRLRKAKRNAIAKGNNEYAKQLDEQINNLYILFNKNYNAK